MRLCSEASIEGPTRRRRLLGHQGVADTHVEGLGAPARPTNEHTSHRRCISLRKWELDDSMLAARRGGGVDTMGLLGPHA